MAELSEEDVNNLCDMLGATTDLDKQMFLRALKDNNGDISKVADLWFTGEDTFRSKYSWDEGQFMADRDGTNVPSFDVQGPDQYPAGDWGAVGGLSAPSRPPSRAKNRSPLGAPTTQQQYDDDLHRALLESASNVVSGGVTPQESGVMNVADTSLPFFGPANRENYDNDQWAMVRVNKEASDPPPSGRKRDPHTPVFLACRQQGIQRHRLGPLLMINHSIPAARNFFLALGSLHPPQSGSYGNNNAWWRGDPIFTTESELADDLAAAWPTNGQGVKLVDELQRLMAFLDATERTYGTADLLCESPMMKNIWGDYVVRLYQSLYIKTEPPLNFTSWNLLRLESDVEDPTTNEVGILEFNVPNELSEVLTSLYSLWDAVLWLNQETELSAFPEEESTRLGYVERPAEVLTIRIKLEGHSIEVPETFYIDRYLEANLETARALKSNMFRVWEALKRAKVAEKKITKWHDPKNVWVELDKTVMINKVIEKVENQIWHIRAKALWRKYEESIGTKEEIPYLPKQLIHLAELNEAEDEMMKHFEAEMQLAKRRLAQIDQQLARLKAEKEVCCAMLREMSKVLAAPSNDPKMNPTNKYTLRGVITSPDVVYMCRRRAAEPFETENAGEKIDQWWRISWVAGDAKPVKQEATVFEKVQEAIFSEVDTDGSKAPILVYATDRALDEESWPLSSALQTFVKFDNRLFKQELLEEPTPTEKKRNAPQSPRSPPKRHRSDSVDSMATNRASMGDFSDVEERAALLSDQVLEDDPFQFGDGLGTELGDMQPQPSAELAAAFGGAPPSPPMSAKDDKSERGSPGIRRSSERLANISLNDEPMTENGTPAEMKGPEMKERVAPVSPFFVRRPNSAVIDKRASIMDQAMEIDGSMEVVDGNPEDYYK
ncbi:hypothetical protein VSDG_07871 [Cytospora chrysosperma]|uniref:Ubiquitin interaction domain-containing protein n=1 Tax=Cytospora chrysosperma TaxID=252740 RepID=A0A423VJN0_CYTCH|nr:hypothetical protein VSDG_07871 [Valsa sordida]